MYYVLSCGKSTNTVEYLDSSIDYQITSYDAMKSGKILFSPLAQKAYGVSAVLMTKLCAETGVVTAPRVSINSIGLSTE
jgi:hypothetical protein